MSNLESMDIPSKPMQYGKLAQEYCKLKLPLRVLRSAAGYYIGTQDEQGPCSRESEEYWPVRLQAEGALEHGLWTQKETP